MKKLKASLASYPEVVAVVVAVVVVWVLAKVVATAVIKQEALQNIEKGEATRKRQAVARPKSVARLRKERKVFVV